jgi:transcriptional regulator with XRE-family HTH domain
MAKNAIAKWLQLATPALARQLAKAADTSVPHLRHIAAGRRSVSAELAQRLAHASKSLHIKMLLLDQRLLCKACGACPIVDKRKSKIAA